jgi:hypothetical protein
MAKYLFVYHGGGMPQDPAEIETIMQAWGAWFESLGGAVVDGGNPVGLSTTVSSDGSIVEGGGSNPASGYSLIEASSVENACEMARGCPILGSGGSVEVAEAIDM